MIDSKYTEAVDNVLDKMAITLHPEEAKEDLELCKVCMLESLGKTKIELAKDFKTGVDNGYSIEFQINLIEQLLSIYNKITPY